jgi:ATP adenylyltransferase
MDRLWTPWRLAFVEHGAGGQQETAGGSEGRAACFLCAKPADPVGADRENLVLFRGQRAYVLLNLYPYNSGHLMVAPYAHVGDLPALPEADAAELFALVRRAVAVLRDEYRPEGFNVGMNLGLAAGAGVPDHLHLHVVPRWSGDTNFMPVLGDTKVLPESLAQTYDRLRPRFAAAADAAAR